MIVREGKIGRVFTARLEDGDRLPGCIEQMAGDNGVEAGVCMLIGGAGGGELVVGPKDGTAEAIEPMIAGVADVHEIAAVGTIFADESGAPKLHMHGALGRGQETTTGCVRRGVDIWKIAEVVLIEITDAQMVRKVDPQFGFEVLAPR
jgi:predicted DNA-binding protein with PD1-like motif